MIPHGEQTIRRGENVGLVSGSCQVNDRVPHAPVQSLRSDNSRMNFKVKISKGRVGNLSEAQNALYEAVKAKLAAEDIVPVESSGGLSITERGNQISSCHGLLVLGFALWKAERTNERGKKAFMPSEFAHIETVMALQAAKPVLILREKSVNLRGVFRQGLMPPLNADMPTSLGLDWLKTQNFEDPFRKWVNKVKNRRDVFLGYCGSAVNVAHSVQLMLIRHGFSVLDWQEFVAGSDILTQISEAASRTTCGVFLFTKDDMVVDGGGAMVAAPRDNVVFEVGYFASAKGKRRTLIILEEGARVPADLAGEVYIILRDRKQTESLEGKLMTSLAKCLEEH